MNDISRFPLSRQGGREPAESPTPRRGVPAAGSRTRGKRYSALPVSGSGPLDHDVVDALAPPGRRLVCRATASNAGFMLRAQPGDIVVIVAGCDPGFGGAIALYDTHGGGLQISDMPVHVVQRSGKIKREIDVHTLADILRADRIGHLFVEQVSSMPGQGVSGVFAFGKAFGIVIGVATTIGIPMSFVSPAKWKRGLDVPAAKDGARARASQLFPTAAAEWQLAKHDGRAEAALIALWGVRSFNAIAKSEAA